MRSWREAESAKGVFGFTGSLLRSLAAGISGMVAGVCTETGSISVVFTMGRVGVCVLAGPPGKVAWPSGLEAG